MTGAIVPAEYLWVERAIREKLKKVKPSRNQLQWRPEGARLGERPSFPGPRNPYHHPQADPCQNPSLRPGKKDLLVLHRVKLQRLFNSGT